VTRRKWSEVRERLRADPERRARIERLEQEVAQEVRLGDLRRARGLTQRQLAAAMGTPQPGIARLEKQADLYVSTLRSYVEAMGGELIIGAAFPDATIHLTDFASLADPEEEASGAAWTEGSTDSPIIEASPTGVVERRPRGRRGWPQPIDEGG
jgi:transcriptional regulator with XRE-family HTH domain